MKTLQARFMARQILQMHVSLQKQMANIDLCGTIFLFSRYLRKMENQQEPYTLCARFLNGPGMKQFFYPPSPSVSLLHLI